MEFVEILYKISQEPIRRTFAPDFMFGVATASYQVEGGAFADGKNKEEKVHMTGIFFR